MLTLGYFEITFTALSTCENIQPSNNLFGNTSLTQPRLNSLIFIECVTKERLRFPPIARGFTRQAARDDIVDDILILKKRRY